MIGRQGLNILGIFLLVGVLATLPLIVLIWLGVRPVVASMGLIAVLFVLERVLRARRARSATVAPAVTRKAKAKRK